MIKAYYTETTDNLSRLDSLWPLLSADEQARAQRFVFEHDQQQCVVAHALKRIKLAQWLQVDPTALMFDTGAKGKPFLVNHTLEYNISHSHGAVLMAISGQGPIGVDIEKMRSNTDFHALANRYFTQNEAAYLQQLDGDEVQQQFYRYWVAKEAILKAQGEGIAHFLGDVEVTSWGDIIRLPSVFPPPDCWVLQFLTISDVHMATVALPFKPRSEIALHRENHLLI